jgi:hypothetical protein
MGMRLVASLILPNHSCLNTSDNFFLIAMLTHDLRERALLLDDFWMILLQEDDGIDHAAHIMGTISGMIWASSLILWEKHLSC